MTTASRACVHREPTPTVKLLRPSDATRLDDLSAVLDALWPSVRPACAACEVDTAADAVASFVISDEDAYGPPDVVSTGDHLVSRVGEIEKSHLLDAFGVLLERHSGRMRLLDFGQTKARVFCGPGEGITIGPLPAPLVHRRGMTFAIGPTDSVGLPLGFSVIWVHGQLKLVLRMYWTLWSEPGQPEFEALRACLESFVRSGWQVDVASHAFQTLVPR